MNVIEKNHKVYVGIGSNIKQVEHIKACIKSLKKEFIDLELSPTYESSSMGFDGPNFYNLVATFRTNHDVVELKKILNAIECPAHIHPITQKTHHTMINDTTYEKMIINQIDINYEC